MKLGIVTYFVPFMFIADPRLVAIGSAGGILYAFAKTAVAVILVGCGLEGYLVGVEAKINMPLRIITIFIGIVIALPMALSDIIGLVAAAIFLGILFAMKKAGKFGRELEAAQSLAIK